MTIKTIELSIELFIVDRKSSYICMYTNEKQTGSAWWISKSGLDRTGKWSLKYSQIRANPAVALFVMLLFQVKWKR